MEVKIIASVLFLLLGITSQGICQSWPTNLPTGFTFPSLPTGWTFPSLPPDFSIPTLPPIYPIDEALVEVPELGKIQGALTYTSPNATPFYWFAGIPYADSDSYMGENRFKPALMKNTRLSDSDDKAFPAINPLVFCPQSDVFTTVNKNDLGEVLKAYKQNRRKEITPNYQGVEDCLVINVNTPKIPRKEGDPLLPVILFVHGGSFDGIWGGIFGGHRLLNRPVVLVSINYRLGILGSLNLENDAAPGNAAMYDVILSLEWVQKYIGYFGGDKEKVTVTGHSAGAVMATHLLTSPLAISKKLFHGIIGLSGSSVSAWTTCTNPLHHHLRVANHAGCPYEWADPNNTTAIAVCMRRKTIDQLRSAVNAWEREETALGHFGYDAFVPSIQNSNTLLKTEIFMSETPLEVIKKGEQANVPVMMGAARHDGTFVLESNYDHFLKPNGYDKDPLYLRNQFLKNLMQGLGIEDTTGAMIHSLAYTYLGESAMNSDSFEEMIPGLIDIHSVFAFKAGAYNLVEMHAKKNPNSFYFAFDYQGKWTVDGGDVIPGGVGHIDEIYYLFQAFPLLCQEEVAVASRFVDYWTNFATYGNPNGPPGSSEIAPPYNADTHPFLIINGLDSTGYHCRDSWINASLEIKGNTNPPTFSPGPCKQTTTTTTPGPTSSDFVTTPTNGTPTDENVSGSTKPVTTSDGPATDPSSSPSSDIATESTTTDGSNLSGSEPLKLSLSIYMFLAIICAIFPKIEY